MRGGLVALSVAGLVALATPAPAEDACGADADRLRAHLEDAAIKTRRWNVAWGIAFAGAAAGQVAFALAELNPLGDFDPAAEETLYVGAVKATLGLATRVIMPVGVDVPAIQDDRCAELEALRSELTKIAKRERRTFWLTHLGGTALNLAGAAFLWSRHSFKDGAVSFAISYPVGVLSAYTLPRASWKRWRTEQASWVSGVTVGVAPSPQGTLFTVGGAF